MSPAKYSIGYSWQKITDDSLYDIGFLLLLCLQLFPSRDRRNIKNKFNREEREYPDEIREALHPKSMDASDKAKLLATISARIKSAKATSTPQLPAPSQQPTGNAAITGNAAPGAYNARPGQEGHGTGENVDIPSALDGPLNAAVLEQGQAAGRQHQQHDDDNSNIQNIASLQCTQLTSRQQQQEDTGPHDRQAKPDSHRNVDADENHDALEEADEGGDDHDDQQDQQQTGFQDSGYNPYDPFGRGTQNAGYDDDDGEYYDY